MNVDDPRDVGRALRSWLAGHLGRDVTVAEEPTLVTGGFDNRIYRLRFSGDLPEAFGRPLVARIQQSADRLPIAEREARIQSWCAESGYPTPRVLAVIAPDGDIGHPVQLMELAPGTTMFAKILRRPWRAPRYLDALAALHVRLHELPTEAWPEMDQGGLALAERRLALVVRVCSQLGSGELVAALESVRRDVLPRLLVDAPQVCHGDFHPLNVLVDGDDLRVIDWTDAGLGDRHGDIARTAMLFRVASVAADSPIERRVLSAVGPRLARRYLRAYRRHLDVDPERIALWEPLHLLHGWAQVTAATAGMFEDAPDRVQTVRPELADWLRTTFERSMRSIGA